MIKEKDLMVRLMQALFPGIKVYLFGSRARGDNRPASDIDLALDAGRPLTFTDMARAREILNALSIPEKIDVVDIHSISEELRDIILKEGVIWTN